MSPARREKLVVIVKVSIPVMVEELLLIKLVSSALLKGFSREPAFTKGTGRVIGGLWSRLGVCSIDELQMSMAHRPNASKVFISLQRNSSSQFTTFST